MAKKDKKRKKKGPGQPEQKPEAPQFSPQETLAGLAASPPGRFLTHPLFMMAVLFFSALWIRYYVAHFYAKGPDNFQYLALARDMARGDYFRAGFDLDEGLAKSRRLVPMYPTLVATGIRLGADPEIFGTWVSILMGSLTILPLFGIGLRLSNKWGGLAAGIFYSVLPLDMQTSGHILTESTFNFFTVSNVFLVLLFLARPSLLRAALVGVAATLAYLTRDIGFGYIILGEAAFLVAAIVLRWQWKQWAIYAGAALIAFSVCSAPYWAIIKARTGGFGLTLHTVPSLKADMMGYEKGSRPRIVDEGDDAEPGGAASTEAVSFNPFRLVVKVAGLAWEYVYASRRLIKWPLFVFAGLGLALFPWKEREKWADEAVLFLWVGGVMGAYALITPYMVDTRYYLPAAVLACVWAGRGAAIMPYEMKRIIKGKSGIYFAYTIIILLFIGIVFAFAPWIMESIEISSIQYAFTASITLVVFIVAYFIIKAWKKKIKLPAYMYAVIELQAVLGIAFLFSLFMKDILGPKGHLAASAGIFILSLAYIIISISKKGLSERIEFNAFVALVCFVILIFTDYAYLSSKDLRYSHDFYDKKNFRGKTVSGHREIAEDAGKLLGIQPGTKILSRKPYFCFYLEANFVDAAETMGGVIEQLKNAEADYVFIGSMSVRRYRPGLKSLVTEYDPLPGAGLVYRRFLGEYNKLFSVYKRGASPLKVKGVVAEGASHQQIQTALQNAARYKDQGYVEHARQILESIIKADSDNALAHRELVKVYMIYGFFDGVSFDRAEEALMRYAFLTPTDPNVKNYKKTIQNLRIQHQAQWGTRR